MLQDTSACGFDPEEHDLEAADFAEDGVVHYMKHLLKQHNVIGLAVSKGQITTFKALKGGKITRDTTSGPTMTSRRLRGRRTIF